jgi:hypothetical protein
MKRYWMKIVLGALAIFALGMFLVRAGRDGVGRIKQAVERQSVRLSPEVAAFAVNDIRLGALTQIEFDPDRQNGFPFIDLTVEADSAADLGILTDCLLVASDAESIQGKKGLTCSPETSASEMVEMGRVSFEPSDRSYPIFVPASAIAGKKWFTPPTPGLPGHPQGVTVNNSSLNLQANASGAFMLI